MVKNLNVCGNDTSIRASKLLKRRLLKKMIMTVAYNIGFSKARDDFIETINELKYSYEEKDVLIRIFPTIFMFLRGGWVDKNILYKHGREVFLENLLTISGLQLGDIFVPTKYFNVKTEDIRWYTNNKGVFTISYQQADFTSEDNKKTKTAAFVNCVHALDASYLRRIIISCNDYNIKVGTIHDGFLVVFFKSGLLINIANRAFRLDEVDIVPNQNKSIIREASQSILL
jgi:hypothetical protein